MFLNQRQCVILHNLIESLIEADGQPLDHDELLAAFEERLGIPSTEVIDVVNEVSREASYDEIFI